MSHPLNRVLELEKSAYKDAKYSLKSLKKEVKKEHLEPDEVYEELDGLRDELGEAIDLLATKEWGDARTRTDVVVDGETVLEELPVRFLVVLEKHLKRIRKVLNKTDDVRDNEKVDRFSDRVEKLYMSVRTARQEANLTRVDEVDISEQVFDYLFADTEADEAETTNDVETTEDVETSDDIETTEDVETTDDVETTEDVETTDDFGGADDRQFGDAR